MQEKLFLVSSERYEISTKLYSPDDGSVKGVILGVHGFAGDKDSSALKKLANRSTAEGVALLCFDLPAHGESPVDESYLTVENCLQDLLFMADYCRKQFPEAKRYCFATSFGGFLTLIASPTLDDFKTVLRAPAVTMPQHVFLDLAKQTPESFKTAGKINFCYERPLYLDYHFYEDLIQYDALGKIYDKEMLVIHGTVDDVVPFKDAEDFCKSHSSMHLKPIKGADHRFKKEGEMEQVIDAAIQFWKGEATF